MPHQIADNGQVRTNSDFWSVFSDLAARLGENDAILAPGRDTLTYAGLKGRISTIRKDLNRLGIGRGDRVVMVLPNGPEMAVCLLGVMASCIAVPLNPSCTKDEFRHYLGRIRPKALIVSTASRTSASAVAEELGIPQIRLISDTSGPAGAFTLSSDVAAACTNPGWNTRDDISVILLTSGTTSRQKLVPLKGRHLLAYAWGINAIYRLGPSDRSLLLMPLFHGAGLKSSLIVPVANGAAVVCLPDFEPASFFRHLDTFRPTWITAGYAFHKAIVDAADGHRDTVSRARIRFIRSGTGKLEAAVRMGLEQAFGAPVIELYSSSETGAITCSPMPPEQGRIGTVGRAVFNEVAIMDTAGAFLGTNEEGEVVVRGPSVFEGYLDDPEANQTAFAAGWYRSGDLGRLDADGFLTLTGRVKEIINRGGEKISPREIEAVIGAHEAVAGVKALGIPHPSLGEEVVAAVVLRKQARAREADLKAFASERLAAFKVPRRIFIRDAFPLGASRKLDVRTLVRECKQILEGERSPAPSQPLSPTEAIVRDLWQKALGTEHVRLDGDFFLLGGDSLKALELLVAIERTFGVAPPVDSMYAEVATVSGMATAIDRLRAAANSEARACPPKVATTGLHRQHRSHSTSDIPAWQQAIRDKCHHESGTFIEFEKADVEQSIPERFDHIALEYPRSLALKTNEHQLTYGALNRAANRVAFAIAERRGHEPGPVAVLIDSAAHALIAFLGILKAGKFYVPLDPSFPASRTAYMLDDSGAELIVTTDTQAHLASRLVPDRARILELSDSSLDGPDASPSLRIPPEALAYILYTSGSSGQPKGVAETHRNVLHEIMRLTNDLHICREDRITLLNSLSFSGSARSIYGSLLNGASLYPYDIKQRGLGGLSHWLIDEAITIYRSGPTILRQVVATLTGEERFDALRLITTAGEVALKGDVESYRKHFSPDCIFVNGLRTTETGSVRHYFIDKATGIPGATVPVGYPIPDMEIRLLDENGGQTPPNEAGEIAVCSRYLSPGYWKKPALTNEKFLPDPGGGMDPDVSDG